MGFGDWLRSQRKAYERGDITPKQYANELEKKASETTDQGNKDFLTARARFIRDDAENKTRAKREAKKPRGLG